MNTQNILKYYGTKLDVRLDSSEFYDYEVSKIQDDHAIDVLDLSTPITYNSLKISDSLEDFACQRETITLTEYDNRVNDSSYLYSGFSTTLTFETFVNHLESFHKYMILNNDVYLWIGENDEVHYMKVAGYNDPLFVDTRMGTNENDIINSFNDEYFYYKCVGKLASETACCGITPKYGVKPWAYQFIQPEPNVCASPIIERRTEKGWTIDLIFNRESQAWSLGGKFYYFGSGGPSSYVSIGDNSLSFGFTSDRRIEWTATRYSGYCDSENGYTESYYVQTDNTPQLCTTGETKDFNITIVFDRYNRYSDCDLENKGGWNDLLGWQISDYEDLTITAVTSTQIASYEETSEFLNKKWADERNRRLGTLKIYLNGRPIYKKENWEEVVVSNRGAQPFIQSWGGSQQQDINHRGVCCFNIKSIKYYEEPLDFLHVRHNFLTRLNQYDFFICGPDCVDELIGFYSDGLLVESGQYTLTEDNNTILF
jgi:hypothetical protein